MIPFFHKGDPLSASQLNQLGSEIRAIAGAGGISPDLNVPMRYHPHAARSVDFACEFRKDDDGQFGLCVHKGRVIVKDKEHTVGEKEWTQVASEEFTGTIKLTVKLDDSGEFVSGELSSSSPDAEKPPSDDDEQGSSREFNLANVDKELVWEYAGGPVYIVEQVCVVEGPGIKIEFSIEEDGKHVYLVKQKNSLSFVAGPGIIIKDSIPPEEDDETPRAITISQEYVLSLIAGPGIKIEQECTKNEENPDEAGVMSVKISAYMYSLCFVAGPGILISDAIPPEEDDETPRKITISTEYQLSLVAGSGIKIEQSFTSGATPDEQGIQMVKVSGKSLCLVAGNEIIIVSESTEDEDIYKIHVAYSLSFVCGPGIKISSEITNNGNDEPGSKSIKIETDLEIEKGNDRVSISKIEEENKIRWYLYGMMVCYVAGPGIEIEVVSDQMAMQETVTIKAYLSFLIGPGLKIIEVDGVELIGVDISWVAGQLYESGWHPRN